MPADEAEMWRRRRAVLRAHHPDLGGDPAELDRQLRLLAPPARAVAGVVFVRRPRGLRGLIAWLGRHRRAGKAPRVR